MCPLDSIKKQNGPRLERGPSPTARDHIVMPKVIGMKRRCVVPPVPLSPMTSWNRISANAPKPASPKLMPAPTFTPRSFDEPEAATELEERYIPTPPIA